jgi:alkanesulfonate monooxygenase SsuD/methylene tetrahydromethanopterin reductase-like flavin-dependent oxidoreductase (luciferase family)
MRVGVTLPTFRNDSTALDAARRAEALSLDGVFVFDHIWPLGRPDLPALSAFPVLGAVAAVTEGICIGPLVARVGLVPDEVLVAELKSLSFMAPGRLIAGLGTGDHKSFDENLSYGIPTAGPDERRVSLARSARHLMDLGVPVWVGGGSPATAQLVTELGAGAALNLWDALPSDLAAAATHCEVTWGGTVDGEVSEIVRRLRVLEAAGATWAVCTWPRSLKKLSEVAGILRGGLAG